MLKIEPESPAAASEAAAAATAADMQALYLLQCKRLRMEKIKNLWEIVCSLQGGDSLSIDCHVPTLPQGQSNEPI